MKQQQQQEEEEEKAEVEAAEEEESPGGGGKVKRVSVVVATTMMTTRRRHERPPLPQEQPPAAKRERIDRVASFVAGDGNEMTEAILMKLLRLTGNHERWGFLSPDHPHHTYYVNRKSLERRRRAKQP